MINMYSRYSTIYSLLLLSFQIHIISCHYFFIGKTGCGKSYIIDGLTGHKYQVKSELQPSSTTTENMYYDEYIDTIGFDDTNLGKYVNMPQWLKNLVPKNTDINGISVGLLAVYDSLNKIRQDNKKLNKIIFVIDDIKISDTQRSILKVLKTIIKSNLLLIINKVENLTETMEAYEQHKNEFENIFGVHDVFYFKRGNKQSPQYKTKITELQVILKKYEKDDFNYELNPNHIDVILNGDPDYIVNYYKSLDCDGYRNRSKTINDELGDIVTKACDNDPTTCKVCHRELIDKLCPATIPGLFVPCENIYGDRCAFDSACLNHQQSRHDKCLDQQKTNNVEKNKLIDDLKDIQSYLTDNCDIAKRTSK